MSTKQLFKVKFLGGKDSVFLKKGKVYKACKVNNIDVNVALGVFFDESDEPGYYYLPSKYFEILSEEPGDN